MPAYDALAGSEPDAIIGAVFASGLGQDMSGEILMTMSTSRARWVLSLVLTVFAGASAHAAVYRGIFDPTYGADFAGLGWRGSATFVVPGNCGVTTETLVRNNVADCSPGLAYVEGAEVGFYNANKDLGNFASVSWGTYADEAAAGAAGIDILSLSFLSGTLDQLSSTLFPLLSPLAPLRDLTVDEVALFDSIQLNAFALQFVIDQVIGQDGNENILFSGPRLYRGIPNCEVECLRGENDVLGNAPEFRIVLIPEPGSLPLVLAALVLAGWVAHRQRRMRAR